MSNLQQRQWLDELDLMRAIGIIAVALIHVTGEGTRLSSDSQLFYIFSGVNYSIQFAVPVFLFISALTLGYNYSNGHNKNWLKYYYNRFFQIVIPYMVWTIIYLYYRFNILGEKNDLLLSLDLKKGQDFISSIIFYGKGYYHLYFMCIIFQFYLLFPALYYIFKYVKAIWQKICQLFANNKYTSKIFHLNNFFMFVLVIYWLQYGFIFLNRYYIYPGFQFNWFGQNYFAEGFKLTGTLVFSYIIPIGLGLWIGFNYANWKNTWRYFRIFVYPIMLVSGWYYVKGMLDTSIYLYMSTEEVTMLKNTYVGFVAVLMLDLCIIFKSIGNKKVKNFFMSLGRCSFGIYLIHPLVLDLLNRNEILNRDSSNIFAYIFAKVFLFVLVIQVSWLLVLLFNKLPIGFLFGSRKVIKKKEKPVYLLAEGKEE